MNSNEMLANPQRSGTFLLPIYEKIEQLRYELSQNKKEVAQQVVFQKTCSKKDYNLAINRENIIFNDRQNSKSSLPHSPHRPTQKKNTCKRSDTNRNDKVSAIINFLASTKQIRTKPVPTLVKKRTLIDQPAEAIVRQKEKVKQRDFQEQLKKQKLTFYPIGEQAKKEEKFQLQRQHDSIRSQTQSLSSSRHQSSSYQSSKLVMGQRQQIATRQYLRKGTRVRQILMRQLQTPDERGSTSSSAMTYLKDYDQWVPSSLVEARKSELEHFMNIIYGGKKVQQSEGLDLQKINVFYL